MSQKYYIVSEEELKRAFNAVYETGFNDGNYGPLDELEKALVSCTSRPVPFALLKELQLIIGEEIEI